ncbi:MAG: ferritin-like domain-containing protein [Pseudomonadales bacterium]|jgi:rubrerythrin|nr:ferritin-like domain-containing protein [Pseudomonadales bacterium]MDP6472266.1 ferritin-like domain-containing protein [Pseudomonadales bacterium]MDP6828060.1 ferritin-like domain-containing protein [Pseudomonadales bacterium]MDP6972577.1 ferritin-like domain-containing protein [Pseudomonadales bacterium]|tara:strand:+ start:1168 stop:2043 length:876 start_codon:yes stop_codon:yes gene_type:complete
MADFLSAFSIQSWLESCPQGYLEETEYGHLAGEKEPESILENDDFLEEATRTTVQLVVGERAALAASSGLINCAPDDPSKIFLATQTLDEARHVEIFTQRLYDLGVKKEDLESTLANFANPNLVKFAEVLLEKVDKRDFVAGVVGQNIVLEGMAFSVFEMIHASSKEINPKFAHTLAGTIADERRHVGFGENRIGSLIEANPERKSDIQKMQQEMTHHMLRTFSDSFQENEALVEDVHQNADPDAGPAMYQGVDLAKADSEEMQAVLTNTVLGEFKTRLARIGLEYLPPAA